jgi:hypothetical protein
LVRVDHLPAGHHGLNIMLNIMWSPVIHVLRIVQGTIPFNLLRYTLQHLEGQAHCIMLHGLIATRLVEEMADRVRTGACSPEEAAERVGRLCACGLLNPSRTAALLGRLAPVQSAMREADHNSLSLPFRPDQVASLLDGPDGIA